MSIQLPASRPCVVSVTKGSYLSFTDNLRLDLGNEAVSKDFASLEFGGVLRTS